MTTLHPKLKKSYINPYSPITRWHITQCTIGSIMPSIACDVFTA